MTLLLAFLPAAEARAWRYFVDEGGGDVYVSESGYVAGTSTWTDTLTNTSIAHGLLSILALTEDGWLVGTQEVDGQYLEVVWQGGTPIPLEAPAGWTTNTLAAAGRYAVGTIEEVDGYGASPAAWDLSDGSLLQPGSAPASAVPSEVGEGGIAAGDYVDGSRGMFLWDLGSDATTILAPSFSMVNLEGAAWSSSGPVALQPNQTDYGPPYTVCFWDGTTLTTLSTAGGWGLGIDDAGRVAYDQGGRFGVGVHVWDAGSDTYLGTLAGGDTELLGMADDGLVYVAESPPMGGDRLLWSYDPDTGVYTDVGAIAGVVPFVPAVAPSGLVAFFDNAVGASEAYLWDPSTGELSTVGIVAEGWYGESLVVNGDGLIGGVYQELETGPESAFFAVPCVDDDNDGICDEDEPAASCAVILAYPASGADLTSEGRFVWNGDCSGYWLELSPSPDFPPYDTIYNAQLDVAAGARSHVFPAAAWPNIARRFVNGGYARVRGSDGGAIATTDVVAFDTSGVPSSFPTPVGTCTVAAISPADGAEVSGEPTFQWSTGCTAARLEFSADPTFPLEATLPIGAFAGNRATLSAARWAVVAAELPEGGYWRVVAGASDGEHASTVMSFVVP